MKSFVRNGINPWKKKLSTEQENVPITNNQLYEDNTDIDLVIKSCTDCSVKDRKSAVATGTEWN